MSQQIIEGFPKEKLERPSQPFLNVSEFYYDTIQGEGVYTGVPAAFLRLQNCTLNCVFCDTKEVWRTGNPYKTQELLNMIESVGLAESLLNGQHLVITGGSPLLQQINLIKFIEQFDIRFGFLPFIEIENECVIQPLPELCAYVDCWNNSPKLSNSKIDFKNRYNAIAIGTVAVLENSWFKFVVNATDDWYEIFGNYIEPGFVDKSQVILMPEGATAEEISSHREMVIQMAIQNGVRYCTREHIMVWGKKYGV